MRFLLCLLFLLAGRAEAQQLSLFQTSTVVNASSSTAGTYTTFSPLGLSGEGAYFVTTRFAIRANFALSFSSGMETAMLLGGGGGASYSLIGGKPGKIDKNDFHLTYVPSRHVYAYSGLAARNYDMTATIPAPKPSATGVRGVTPRTGQFFAPEFGLGYDTYLTYLESMTIASARINMMYSLNSPLYYTFFVVQLQFGVGFNL